MNCSKHPENNATGMCTYCGKAFCADCLVEVSGKMVCRDDVTHLLNDAKQETATAQQAAPVNIYNTNANSNVNTATAGGGILYPRKSKMTALLLCIFLGAVGGHRFYLGKTGSALVYLFTCGGFYIGWIVDIILILTNNLTDNYGQPLV